MKHNIIDWQTMFFSHMENKEYSICIDMLYSPIDGWETYFNPLESSNEIRLFPAMDLDKCDSIQERLTLMRSAWSNVIRIPVNQEFVNAYIEWYNA